MAALPPPEVLVHAASLDVSAGRLLELRATLSRDETERAEAMPLDRARRRFVAGRGLLREVLARAAGAAPTSLVLGAGPRGKPFLQSPARTPGVEFNASHSEDLLLVAVARGRRVGIDVEVRRAGTEIEALAERFFSPLERVRLLALPPLARRRAFFAAWTRKEAYMKARGEGMSIPLDRFDVSLAPGEPARLIEDRGEPGAAQRWKLIDLELFAEAAAALAVEAAGGERPTVRVERALPA